MKFKVKTSATSANIGAGFDCMGLALGLYNEMTVSDEGDKKLEIIGGVGVPCGKDNLIYRSMREVFKIVGREPKSIKIEQYDAIPMASGLGSSAACVVSGVAAANALVGSPLSMKEMVAVCSRMDGHPDNVLPALLGGVTAGVMTKCGVEYIREDAVGIKAVALTPNFPLHTEESRKALPDSYSREDVVFSLSRAVLGFAALTSGQVEKLAVVDDRLHQPYRKPLINGYEAAEKVLKDLGALCVYLSGAGPTLVGLFRKADAVGKADIPDGWARRDLEVENSGIRLIPLG